MIDPGRVLQPLDEAADDVNRLTDYETPAELARAVASSASAVERVLRRLLRADPAAPEALRLSALSSADLPFPRVLEALRQRNLVSIRLAGSVHELQEAARRAEAGQPRAGDADVATRAIERVRDEVRRIAERPMPAEPAAAPAAAAPADATRSRAFALAGFRWSRRFAWVAAAVALAILIVFAYTYYDDVDSDLDEAVTLFTSGRETAAEQKFLEVLRDAPDNVTARLYLARVYRRSGRLEQAREMLREAAQRQPDDADVRRELGHLLMSMGRPQLAIEQYERAVALEPEESSGWIGLVTALRAARDPRAETVLQRAPTAARAQLGPPRIDSL